MVLRRGDGQATVEHGCADLAGGQPATLRTVFRVASITKPILSLVAMRLATDGVLALGRPVHELVPECAQQPWYQTADPLDVMQLLSHQSGLLGAEDGKWGDPRDWPTHTLAGLGDARTGPRRRFAYSNIGFALGVLAIARAAAAPIEELVAAYVIDPLQLRHTGFLHAAGALTPCPGYTRVEGGFDPDPAKAEHSRGRGYRAVTGGMYSTADDLASLLVALWTEKLLPRDAVAEWMRPRVEAPGSAKHDAWGVGIALKRTSAESVATHGGDFQGYLARIAFQPDRKVAAVLLRNYSEPDTNIGASVVELACQLSDASPAAATAS